MSDLGDLPNKYFTVCLRDLPVTHIDEVTDMVFEGGAAGTEESLAFSQPDLQYEAQSIVAEITDLKIYFLRPPPHELLAKIHNIFGCSVYVQEDEHKDWLEEWKKGYEAFPLTGGIWVVPNWRQKPEQAERAIFLEPGMAFGTGTHATTQLAAKLLANLDLKNRSLVDIGSGTGILAILGSMLGCKNVLANDIDKEARRTARENVTRNQVPVSVTDDQITQLQGQYDVVVANIVDGILLKLRPELFRLMGKDSDLILSGILIEREKQFLDSFIGDEFTIRNRLAEDEWCALHLRKK